MMKDHNIVVLFLGSISVDCCSEWLDILAHDSSVAYQWQFEL